MERIYLDHNATSPPLPEVVDAMLQAWRHGYANPASQHEAGRQARRRLEQARESIAAVLGASTAGVQPDRLLFTSGGTESNNHALLGMLGADPRGQHVLVSAIEHPSVSGLVGVLEARGAIVDRIPVTPDGTVSVDDLAPLLRDQTRLVSVMLGNNETGALQPVEAVVEACSARGTPVHTDATQVVGKLPVDFQRLGVSLLTFSAHKFQGPRGIGGLLVRGGLELTPLLHGQPGAERPGTPSLELAVGAERALQLYAAEATQRADRLRGLRDRLESRLLKAAADVRVICREVERTPHTSCLAFVGLNRQGLQMALDRAGVACSTGSACASGSSEPSPTLLAMGLPPEVVEGAIRLSLGAATTVAEIDTASERILKICKRLRELKEP